MKVRKLISRVHLCLGFVVSIFIIAVTLSGTILVFRSDIEHMQYAHLYQGHPGVMRMEDIKKAVLKQYPKQKIATIARDLNDTSYEVQMRGDDPLYVYVDAGTGKVLGDRDPEDSFLGWIKEFHTELFLGDTGEFILGVVGLCFLVLLITGSYLWWPGIKRWARGFTLRLRRRNWYIRHYDLHKLVGICVLPFLTMIVIAGISFCFSNQAKTLWYAVTFTQPTAPAQLVSRVPAKNAQPLDMDTLQAQASAAVPGGTLTQYILPSKKTSAVQMWFSLPYDPRAGAGFDGQVRIYLDQYSGRVLWSSDPRKLSLSENIYQNWRFPLHIGSYGQLPTRILQVVVGLAPTFLAITGISMWYLKWSAKKKQQRSQRRETKEPVFERVR